MKKNKNGFTLVELLAVIVILAIILAIAIPSITTITNRAKADSFAANAKLIIRGMEYAILQNSGTAITTGAVTLPAYGATSAETTSITVDTGTSGAIQIDIIGAGKFANCTLSNITYNTAIGSAVTGTGCAY